MHMQAIRDVARGRGMKTGRLTKVELVREIQRTEGNAECFATASSGTCEQLACLWRDVDVAIVKRSALSNDLSKAIHEAVIGGVGRGRIDHVKVERLVRAGGNSVDIGLVRLRERIGDDVTEFSLRRVRQVKQTKAIRLSLG